MTLPLWVSVSLSVEYVTVGHFLGLLDERGKCQPRPAHCGFSKPWQLVLRDEYGSGQETQHRAQSVRPRSPGHLEAVLCAGVALSVPGGLVLALAPGQLQHLWRMNGAQCGGSAELRAPFVLPRVAVGSAAGDLPEGGCPTGPPQRVLEASHTLLRNPEHTMLSFPPAFAWAGPTPEMQILSSCSALD